MSYGSEFALTLFTANPTLAQSADSAGIERIGIDLERIGKRARQGHLQTWISDHEINDLLAISSGLRRAKLFARCNPINSNSEQEINQLVACGVKVIMLPNFKTCAEAEFFLRILDDRAYPVLLVETAEATAIVPDLCRIPGACEIHFGLNDLRLSLGLPSHFHVLTSALLSRMSSEVLSAGLRLGVGGLGKIGDVHLPIPPDLVVAQMWRLGATASLVARSFTSKTLPENLYLEVDKLRVKLDTYSLMSAEWHEQKRIQLANLAEQLFRQPY